MSGFQSIRSDRTDGYGGAAILISDKLQFTHIQIPPQYNNDTVQTCAISVKSPFGDICIISVYARPQHKLKSDYWSALSQSTNSTSFIMGGDFNAHHPSYGCTFADVEGREIVDFMNHNNLCILNDGSPTLINKPGSANRSAIDLTISSPNIAPHINWSVLDEPLGSDHLPIVMDMSHQNLYTNQYKTRKRWKISEADWDAYTLHTNQSFENINQNQNPQTLYTNIKEAINSAAAASIPEYKEYKGKRDRPAKPWWDVECVRAREATIQSYSAYKNHSTLDNYIRVKQTSAKCRLLFKNKKKSKWKQYCEEFNVRTPSKTIWNKIKALKIGLGRRDPLPTNQDWLTDYLHHLAPDYVPLADVFHNRQINTDGDLEAPFQFHELEYVLKSNNNTSPGPDGIHYSMLSNLSRHSKLILLHSFNQIWLNNAYISDWTKVIIIPLLKPGKPPDHYLSYRPIALSSCVGKTYERLIKLRLEWWAESQGLIPPHQNGFRTGRSTMDTLTSFISEVHTNNSNNNYLLAVSVDLEDAYNKVNINLLMDKLLNLGCPNLLARNIYNLQKERSVTVWYDGEVIGPRLAGEGLPQGAVLSPLLFNLYTSDLFNALPSPHTKIEQFADDILLYCTSNDLHSTFTLMEQIMNSFLTWCISNNFSLQQNKSKSILFTRHRTTNLPSHLSFGPYRIELVTSIKLLGVYIDNKLLWNIHIQQLINKCEQALNIIRCINHHHYGADVKTSLLLYRQLIRPRMDYGCFIYGDAANSHLAKLDRFQFKTLRCCLGALTSTPTNALQVEANEPPLSIRREKIAAKFLLNRIKIASYPISSKLSDLSTDILTHTYWANRKMPAIMQSYFTILEHTGPLPDLEMLPYHKFPLHHSIIPNSEILTDLITYDPSLSNNINNAKSQEKLHRAFPDAYRIFTDGSKIDNKVGCAIYDPQTDHNIKFKLKPTASVFSAEVLAIAEALKYILSLPLPNRQYIILSDSLSALSKLKLPGNNPPYLILYTVDLLKQLAATHQIHLIWVKAHIGLPGNEKVDLLAKEATTSGTPSFNNFLPSDIMETINKNNKAKWQNQYSESAYHKGKFYHAIQSEIPTLPWYHNVTGSRRFFSVISRLRFNHNFSPQHLHRIGLLSDSKCACGQDEADSTHILLECPLTANDRNQIWSVIYSLKLHHPLNLQLILKTTNIDLYHTIFKFLIDNKINI